MVVKYTKHANKKFRHEALLKLGIKKENVQLALISPDYTEENKFLKVKYCLKAIDKDHNLRVVYKEEDGIITVITAYPVRKGRYEN